MDENNQKQLHEYHLRSDLEASLLALSGASRHLIDATVSAFRIADQDQLLSAGLAEEENFRGDRVGIRISDRCWFLLSEADAEQ